MRDNDVVATCNLQTTVTRSFTVSTSDALTMSFQVATTDAVSLGTTNGTTGGSTRQVLYSVLFSAWPGQEAVAVY